MCYRPVQVCLSILVGLSLWSFLVGCGGGPSQPPPPPHKTLTAIEISPANSTTSVGATLQFSAKGTYDDGSTGDVTQSVQWTSSNSALASISGSGTVAAAAIGRPKITATSGSLSVTTTLIVISGTASLVPRFAFAPDLIDNTISIFTMDSNSGQLRHNGYALVKGNPVALAVSPTGKFAFTADSSSNSISAYGINASSGSLNLATSVSTGNGPNSVAVDPSDTFVYTADQAGDVSGFAINSSSGALSAISGSPFAAGTQSVTVRIHPSGLFLYVANASSSNISAYRIDAATGALNQITGSPFPTGMQPFGLEIDPTGKFMYVANEISKTVTAFAIDQNSGSLTEITGSPFPAGESPNSLTVDPSSKYVYVTNTDASTVSAFNVGATGALTAVTGSPFPTGAMPNCVTVDPTGKFAYVVNLGTPSESVTAFSIDANTGALNFVEETRTRGQATSLTVLSGGAAVTYTPKFLYATNPGSNNLSGYAIDPATGSLAALPTSPTATGQNPFGVASDPSGKFVYVSNGINTMTGKAEKSISGFVAANDGSLTPMTGSPFPAGTGTTGMAVDPSGRFLYAANFDDFTVSVYTINPATGVLTEIAGSPYQTGREPVTVTIDPEGQVLYIGNQNNTCDNPPSASCPISAFQINANDGSLTPIQSPSTGGIEPTGVAVDPTGKYLYLSNSNEAVISQFKITPVDGSLALLGMTTPPQTSEAAAVAIDPSGKYVITDIWQFALGQAVNSFGIDPLTGKLPADASMTLPTAGFLFYALAFDPSGKYVYAADEGEYPSASGKIWGFNFSPATGELTLISSTPWAAGVGTMSIAVTGEIQ